MGKIRDAGRTKKTILKAALQEFADNGYAGARVSAIARRARVNKQLIYHYFDGKEGLFRTAMEVSMKGIGDLETIALDPVAIMSSRFQNNFKHLDYYRTSAWEAARAEGVIFGEEHRKMHARNVIDTLKVLQKIGALDEKWEPRLLLLAIHSLTVYPMIFWQVTDIITGMRPTDPEFQQKWTAFLDLFSEQLFGRTGGG